MWNRRNYFVIEIIYILYPVILSLYEFMSSHDSGTIVFSPNGFGVRLLTNYGELHFSSDEFNYYQAIYNVLTTSSSSPIDLRSSRGHKVKEGIRSSKNSVGPHSKEDNLSFGSYQLLSILIRTDISCKLLSDYPLIFFLISLFMCL